MGQDICSNVCCHTEGVLSERPTIYDLANVPIENPIQANSSIVDQQDLNVNVSASSLQNEIPTQDDPPSEEEPLPMEYLLKELSQIRDKFMDMTTPKEIFLSIDDMWKNQMKIIEKPLYKYYTKISDNQYIRNGEDNNKFQILFRQHIPIFGIFFFQIQILEYEPKNGLQFIIGVANHLQAIKKFQSKGGDYQDSFIYKKPKQYNAKTEEKIKVDAKLKVEINRKQNSISLYVNDLMTQTRTLKKELTGETASLAPYIQTQFLGVTFSWKELPLPKSATYKMSTIIQEESSINATQ